jgi:hypothetical protein
VTQLIKTEGHDDDMPIYTKLQVGLFYTSLICEERLVDDILKIVQLINQDNFSIFVDKFNSVVAAHQILLCFHRVKGQYYERLVQIASFLFDCIGEKIVQTLALFLRNAYFQDKNPEMLGFINLLVDLITAKKEKISERSDELWCKILFKALRLMSITMLYKSASDLHAKLVALCRYIWEKHRKGSAG